ncbi:MAG: DJ-1 family glyoxalase III [Oscillospiraceae bacterium]
MVYIILGRGFEETEAIAPYDVLSRGGVPVCFAGIGGKTVVGSHGISVNAECTVEDINVSDADIIVVPGGLGGVDSILGSRQTLDKIKAVYDAGARAAAICAGPTVLASLGITDGKNAVCYPGFETKMGNANMSQEHPAVVDGRVITGRAAGASLAFGLKLLEELRGVDAAKKVADSICYEG